MKRVILSKEHIDGNPDLPEIPDFSDFAKIFKRPQDFGDAHKRDLRISGNYECDLHDADFTEKFGALTEFGMKNCYYGSDDFVSPMCFWYMYVGNNGWCGLALFDKEYKGYYELGAGESFNKCLAKSKDLIESYLRDCANENYENELGV